MIDPRERCESITLWRRLKYLVSAQSSLIGKLNTHIHIHNHRAEIYIYMYKIRSDLFFFYFCFFQMILLAPQSLQTHCCYVLYRSEKATPLLLLRVDLGVVRIGYINAQAPTLTFDSSKRLQLINFNELQVCNFISFEQFHYL